MRGTVKRRVLASGAVRYDVRFREGGRGSAAVSRTFDTKAEADLFCGEQTGAVKTGKYQRVDPLPLAEVFAAWLAENETNKTLGLIRKSTCGSFASNIRLHILPVFGHLRSDQISKDHIGQWKTACAKRIAAGEIAAKSYNNHVGALSAALAWARDRGYLAHHPFPKKLRSKKQGAPRLFIQGGQIAAAWHAATGQDRVILGLGMFGGMRRGEIFGARWDDVIWPSRRFGGTLRVTQTFVQREIIAPKTAAGVRAIDLSAKLVDLLRAHFKARPPVVGPDGFAYIVRQDNGAPLDPDNWYGKTWPTIRAAGQLPAGLTLHGLRHTFASILLGAGVDSKYLSEQIGHTDEAFTRKQYQHLLKKTRQNASRVLDRAIPSGRAPKVKPALRLVKKRA